jgi:FtsH-binding integral membrane protein
MAQKRSQLETTLAYMAVGVIATSILAILTTLLLALFEVENITPLVVQLPLVGLPIGFLLIIALLVTSVIRNRRENRN